MFITWTGYALIVITLSCSLEKWRKIEYSNEHFGHGKGRNRRIHEIPCTDRTAGRITGQQWVCEQAGKRTGYGEKIISIPGMNWMIQKLCS